MFHILTSWVSRGMFAIAFIAVGIAVWEKLLNMFGFTVLTNVYRPWRFFEVAAVALLFVIALQLREIKMTRRI